MKTSRLPRIFLLNGEPGPSYKLVAQWPFAVLESQGVCEVRSALAGDLRLFGYLLWCDVIFVVRGHTPNAALAVRLAHHLGRFVVVYWDDNIFEVPSLIPKRPSPYELDEIRGSIVEIIRTADILGVANPRLINILQAHASSTSPGVTLKVPAIGLRKEESPPRCHSDIPIIGYAGNIAHKTQMQEIVVPALVQLQHEGWEFRLEVFGPVLNVPTELRSVLDYHEPMRFEEWLRIRDTLNWTIACAPLPESNFYACKFQNKFLDYAALGAPGIFSNVPPYSDVIEHGRTGILVVNSPLAWANAIRELLMDSNLRQRIIQESWRVVSQEHSMASVCESYKSGLKAAFEFRRPSILADPRALFDVGRWYSGSIIRRAIRLIGRSWRQMTKFERK